MAGTPPDATQAAELRRLARRVPLEAQVYCRLLEGAAPAFWAQAVDISLGGICLRTPQPLFRPARLRISLRLPGGLHRVHATGEVTNARRDGDGVLAGLRFIELARETNVELCRFLFGRALEA
jgi:c-di-GMP-binding flagellar brake protein YcgR